MNAVAKSERIQLRTSLEAKEMIFEAAAVTQQDASSFILDAATGKARAVLLEQRILKLSSEDIQLIEDALESADSPSPALVELFRKVEADPRFETKKLTKTR